MSFSLVSPGHSYYGRMASQKSSQTKKEVKASIPLLQRLVADVISRSANPINIIVY